MYTQSVYFSCCTQLIIFLDFFFLTSRYLFLILGIKDPEEKKKKMMELFESLPKPNRLTIIYLLDHLRR